MSDNAIRYICNVFVFLGGLTLAYLTNCPLWLLLIICGWQTKED